MKRSTIWRAVAPAALLALAGPSTAQAQDNVIRVGVTLRMIVENGLKYGQMTKDELDGVEINGKKIQVTLLDDECKPDKGIANVNRLILEVDDRNAPEFPLATALIGPLRAAAEKHGRGDFSPLWSGQNATGCKESPAGDVTRDLAGV